MKDIEMIDAKAEEQIAKMHKLKAAAEKSFSRTDELLQVYGLDRAALKQAMLKIRSGMDQEQLDLLKRQEQKRQSELDIGLSPKPIDTDAPRRVRPRLMSKI